MAGARSAGIWSYGSIRFAKRFPLTLVARFSPASPVTENRGVVGSIPTLAISGGPGGSGCHRFPRYGQGPTVVRAAPRLPRASGQSFAFLGASAERIPSTATAAGTAGPFVKRYRFALAVDADANVKSI